MAQITRNNRHTERRGTLHRPMRSMFGVLETDFSDPGPPPFFEDRPRSVFEDTDITQRESPGLLRAPGNVVTTLAPLAAPRVVARLKYSSAWSHAPIIFLCFVARLNDRQQLRACARS